jgi:IS5 family transposase
LHLVVNKQGEILRFCITPGNVDDRKLVPDLAKLLFGKLFGDNGYISQPLAKSLREMFDIQLIAKLRKNMKNQLMTLTDRILYVAGQSLRRLLISLKTSLRLSSLAIAVSRISLSMCCVVRSHIVADLQNRP